MIVAVVVVVVLFAMALGGIALYVHKLLSSPHSSHKYPFQPTPSQKLIMKTYTVIGLPSLNEGSPVTILSDVSNIFNYSRPKNGNGECYCILSGH
jgi:hypothetical protein